MIIKRVLERDGVAGPLGKITFVSTPSLNNYLDNLRLKSLKDSGQADPILTDSNLEPADGTKPEAGGKDAATIDAAGLSTDGPALNGKYAN